MTFTTTLVTLGASAAALPAPTNAASGGGVCQILIEQLRTNTHVVSIGDSTVTNDGSGTGVVVELAVPGVGFLDRWLLADQGGDNTVQPTQIWVKGTSTEKFKVTYFWK